MKVSELRTELKAELQELSGSVKQQFDWVDARFREVHAKFDQVDAKFDQVDARFDQVDARFEQVDARFEQVDARFEQVDARFEQLLQEVRSEAAATRRHFDVVVEHLTGERNLSLDRSMATAEALTTLSTSVATEHAAFEHQLPEHDARLDALESGRTPDKQR